MGGQDHDAVDRSGRTFFVDPTFADIYDRANDNKPVVGIVATVDIHFGMLGHGSFFNGGDRDIALTRSADGRHHLDRPRVESGTSRKHEAAYYQLPDYANDVPGFQNDVDALDQADGKVDGKWRDNDIDQLLQGFDTPARTAYQQRVVETVVKNEGFGAGRHARPAVPELQGDRLRQPRLVDEQPGDGGRRASPRTRPSSGS